MRRPMLIAALLLAVSAEVRAEGGLMGSAAMSGAGQGLSSASSQMMNVLGASMLQQQAAEAQRLRDEQQMRWQDERDRRAMAAQQAAYDRSPQGMQQQERALSQEWEALAEAKRAARNEWLETEKRVLESEKRWINENKVTLDLRQSGLKRLPDGQDKTALLSSLGQEIAHHNARVADFDQRWEAFIQRAVSNGWVRQ